MRLRTDGVDFTALAHLHPRNCTAPPARQSQLRMRDLVHHPLASWNSAGCGEDRPTVRASAVNTICKYPPLLNFYLQFLIPLYFKRYGSCGEVWSGLQVVGVQALTLQPTSCCYYLSSKYSILFSSNTKSQFALLCGCSFYELRTPMSGDRRSIICGHVMVKSRHDTVPFVIFTGQLTNLLLSQPPQRRVT